MPAAKEDLKTKLMRLVLVALHGILGSGAYGTAGCRALTEGEMSAWIARPEIAALLRTTVLGWIQGVSSRKLQRWGAAEVEEALLEGAVWSAVMTALKN